MNRADPRWLLPQWPAPPAVRALFTTRVGGVSVGPYACLNLAAHVGDEPTRVAANREALGRAAGLPQAPRWLQQVHGTGVIEWPQAGAQPAVADAAWTRAAGVVCAVMVADCAPILLCDRAGSRVAAVHAGWRGAAAGVIEHAITALQAQVARPAEWLAWIGPCISDSAFQVGDEVRQAFVADDPGAATHFRSDGARWRADLAGLCERRLRKTGVAEVSRAGLCTHGDARRFYSHRRDGPCGRMAALIWIDQNSV